MSRTAQRREFRTYLQKQRELTMLQGRLAAREEAEEAPIDFTKYQGRPTAYFHEILGTRTMWDALDDFIRGIHEPPYKILVKSGHRIGKSFSAAGLINYWFDCFNPSVVITLGSSAESMRDGVWSEVRSQRARAGLPQCFVGPKTPELWTGPDHWAKSFSVKKGESFHGKHRQNMLFLFDETTAVERPMFTIARSMFKPEPGNAWICFYNPTDPSTPVYGEEQSGEWRTFSFSSLDHPNVKKQLEHRRAGKGELISSQLPIPNAVSLSQVDGWVKEWTQELDPSMLDEKGVPKSAIATDFQWLDANGRTTWRRPMMDWEARVLGNWLTHATSSVWSDHLFTFCEKAIAPAPVHELPEIGCDVARFGDDRTAVHTRYVCLSLHHESRQGLRVTEVAGWLIEVARQLADMVNQLRTA